MYRKRLAALIMTGCLLTSVGCSTPSSGSGPLGLGLFSGHCCGHSSSGSGGIFGRSSGSSVAATPVAGAAYAGGVDCPCSLHGGSQGVFHPAVLSQGTTGAPISGGGVVMGDVGTVPSYPAQQFQGQPIPVTTPGFPPGMNSPIMQGNPIPGSGPIPGTIPGQAPRIQPIPQAPGGVTPSMGFAPSATTSPWLP